MSESDPMREYTRQLFASSNKRHGLFGDPPTAIAPHPPESSTPRNYSPAEGNNPTGRDRSDMRTFVAELFDQALAH